MTDGTMTPERADYAARCFVCGMRRHGVTGKMEPASGEFASRFLSHPWVRESITEGWGKELRGHLVQVYKTALMRKEQPNDIDRMMPDKVWVDAAKNNAQRYRAAQEWRDEKYGKADGARILERLGVRFGGAAE